jgi:hypothetical protein
VLIYARTSVTTSWLLDIAGEVLQDRRVQVVFTIEDEVPSASVASAAELVADAGALLIPWSEAASTEWDLILASSPRGSYHRLAGPLLLTQHGPGFGKPASVTGGGPIPMPRDPGGRVRRSGRALLTLAVSHPEQATLLEPLPEGAAVVAVGDPLLDRLLASRSARSETRHSLGLAPDQRLVVLSSTWGSRSQFATLPELWAKFSEQLPFDLYRIGMVIHPNIWAAHGRWQLSVWLRRAVDSGVVVLSPGDDWRAGLVAADAVVADHGSVGLYAAALGIPVLLAAFDDEDVIETSALAELSRLAARLDLRGDIRSQIAQAVPVGDGGDQLVRRLTTSPGASLRVIRDVIYGLLQLNAPPNGPRLLSVAPPTVRMSADISSVGLVNIAGPLTALRIEVQRHAAMTPPPPPPPPPAGDRTASCGSTVLRTLLAVDTEPDQAIRQSADVMVCDRTLELSEAEQWLQVTLHSLPGCAVAVCRSVVGMLAWWRDAPAPQLVTVDARVPASVAAAAVYAVGTVYPGRSSFEGKVSFRTIFYSIDGRPWSEGQ